MERLHYGAPPMERLSVLKEKDTVGRPGARGAGLIAGPIQPTEESVGGLTS